MKSNKLSREQLGFTGCVKNPEPTIYGIETIVGCGFVMLGLLAITYPFF